ncbi:hypothetical protein B0H12DRAFT_1233955 [Mycena haematopus]|nr:hypothetical protein B0H12DRAFT_1233955 [Mycena haematopus]
MDQIQAAQDELFYATFPDARRPPVVQAEVEAQHAKLFAPPLPEAFDAVYPCPDVNSWAWSGVSPRLAMALPEPAAGPLYCPPFAPPAHPAPFPQYTLPRPYPPAPPPPPPREKRKAVPKRRNGYYPASPLPSSILALPADDDAAPSPSKRARSASSEATSRSPSASASPAASASTSTTASTKSSAKSKEAGAKGAAKGKDAGAKKPPLACLFCRGRKIACGPPSGGGGAQGQGACK